MTFPTPFRLYDAAILRKALRAFHVSFILTRLLPSQDFPAFFKYGYQVIHLIGTQHPYPGLPEVGYALENRA